MFFNKVIEIFVLMNVRHEPFVTISVRVVTNWMSFSLEQHKLWVETRGVDSGELKELMRHIAVAPGSGFGCLYILPCLRMLLPERWRGIHYHWHVQQTFRGFSGRVFRLTAIEITEIVDLFAVVGMYSTIASVPE